MAEQIKRGPLLTGYLVFLFISSIAGAVSYVVLWNDLTAKYPTWALIFFGVVDVSRFLSILAIWFWSRWGIVAYVVTAAVAIPVFLALGGAKFLMGIVGAFVLVVLIWPKWKFMSWGISSAPKVSNVV